MPQVQTVPRCPCSYHRNRVMPFTILPQVPPTTTTTPGLTHNNPPPPQRQVDDRELPTITCPTLNDVSATSGQDQRSVVWDPPRATDNHRIDRVATSHASGSMFAVGETTVTATAFDASNNTASCQFMVNVLAAASAAENSAVGASAQPAPSSSTGIIAGSTAGAAVLLIAIVVLVVLLQRQRRQSKAPQNWEEIFSLMDQFNSASGGANGMI